MTVLPNEGNGGPRDITRESAAWRAAVFGRLGVVVQKSTWLEQHVQQELAHLRRNQRHMRRAIKAIMFSRSALRTSSTQVLTTRRGTEIRDGGNSSTARRPATLCQRPKFLHVLWDEWLKGVDGRLPAKEFVPSQRGEKSVKYLFCLRKPFWKCMERLIDNGYTAPEALELINDLYPGTVTEKLKALKRHEKLGGHHRLCPRGNGVGRSETQQ